MGRSARRSSSEPNSARCSPPANRTLRVRVSILLPGHSCACCSHSPLNPLAASWRYPWQQQRYQSDSFTRFARFRLQQPAMLIRSASWCHRRKQPEGMRQCLPGGASIIQRALASRPGIEGATRTLEQRNEPELRSSCSFIAQDLAQARSAHLVGLEPEMPAEGPTRREVSTIVR